jgi:hypothetical protein
MQKQTSSDIKKIMVVASQEWLLFIALATVFPRVSLFVCMLVSVLIVGAWMLLQSYWHDDDYVIYELDAWLDANKDKP